MPDAYRFASGPLQLVGHLVTPPGRTASGVPGLVLAHHFHTGAGGAAATADTYPELADRIAAEYSPRSLLVVHGTDDDSVPDFDARVISDAHGSAEMRIIAGAGHQLRDDPRAIAVLLGWLDRERTGAELATPAAPS